MRSQLLKIARPLAGPARKFLGPTRFRKLREALSLGNPHDEVRLIACALASQRGNRGFMLDVGGHRGESFEEFAEHGWNVHSFEPNPANHPYIQKRIEAAKGRVTLFPVAVSDTPQKGLAFYLSDESTGISSLHAFHETHKEGFVVDAVTLSEHCREHGITHVDFLKIDVEGHDFFVLKGIDWEHVAPDVVVCEFEDRKTVPLGYDYRDMADFLVERGYHVIVSEWYPIQRYGTRHKWRRHSDYPCDLAEADGWGNLIAFRHSSDFELFEKEINILRV